MEVNKMNGKDSGRQRMEPVASPGPRSLSRRAQRGGVALGFIWSLLAAQTLLAGIPSGAPIMVAVNSPKQVYDVDEPVKLGLAVMNAGSFPLYVLKLQGVSFDVWDTDSGRKIVGDPLTKPAPPNPTHYYTVDGERVLMDPVVRLDARGGVAFVIDDALARYRNHLPPGSYRVGWSRGTMATYEQKDVMKRDDVPHPLWVKAGPTKSRLPYVCNMITLRITGQVPTPGKTTQGGSPHSVSSGSFWEAAGLAAAFVVVAVDETGNREILMALDDSSLPENTEFRCSKAFAEKALPASGRFLVPASRHGSQFEPVGKEPYGVPSLHERKEDEAKVELYYYQEALREWQSLTTTEAKVAFLRKLLANSILQELHEETAKELARLQPPSEASASPENIEAWLDVLSDRKISRNTKRVLFRSLFTGKLREDQPEARRSPETKQQGKRETPW